MLLKEKKFKLKLCRNCGEVWVLTWDKENLVDYGTIMMDSEFNCHTLFCKTHKLVSEIQQSLGRMINEEKNSN